MVATSAFTRGQSAEVVQPDTCVTGPEPQPRTRLICSFFQLQTLETIDLSTAVAAVNNEVASGRVGGSVRSEIDVCGLELGGLAVAAHGDHAVPQRLGLCVDEVGQTSVNVAWQINVRRLEWYEKGNHVVMGRTW